MEQVINDFYTSLNEKDSALYLKTVVDSASKQPLSTQLEDTKIDFSILQSKKINDYKYEVYVSKTVDGVEYPVTPYDVVLENGQWKFDNSSVIIYPKKVLNELFNNINEAGYKITDKFFTTFSQNIISENENFIVKKFNNIESEGISLFSELNYNFNQKSTDIYSPGTINVYSDPGANDEDDDSYNFVVAELYDEDPIDNYLWDTDFLDAFDNDSTSFNHSGYIGVKVYNFNYPWLTGKYTVTW